MNSMHLANLDLNLLRVFDVLLEERSVTRAGARLGLTPSAVSHALSRLRYHLGDELFRRDAQGHEAHPPRAGDRPQPARRARPAAERAQSGRLRAGEQRPPLQRRRGRLRLRGADAGGGGAPAGPGARRAAADRREPAGPRRAARFSPGRLRGRQLRDGARAFRPRAADDRGADLGGARRPSLTRRAGDAGGPGQRAARRGRQPARGDGPPRADLDALQLGGPRRLRERARQAQPRAAASASSRRTPSRR